MSLDHILDTARKLGIPVIITNDRGQSPQVIMPFEDFASMVGVSTPPGKRTRASRMEDDDEDEEDQGIVQALADMTREAMEYKISKEPEEESELGIQKGSNENTEAFMEEKFYFEPLEDEQEKK